MHVCSPSPQQSPALHSIKYKTRPTGHPAPSPSGACNCVLVLSPALLIESTYATDKLNCCSGGNTVLLLLRFAELQHVGLVRQHQRLRRQASELPAVLAAGGGRTQPQPKGRLRKQQGVDRRRQGGLHTRLGAGMKVWLGGMGVCVDGWGARLRPGWARLCRGEQLHRIELQRRSWPMVLLVQRELIASAHIARHERNGHG